MTESGGRRVEIGNTTENEEQIEIKINAESIITSQKNHAHTTHTTHHIIRITQSGGRRVEIGNTTKDR